MGLAGARQAPCGSRLVPPPIGGADIRGSSEIPGCRGGTWTHSHVQASANQVPVELAKLILAAPAAQGNENQTVALS
jgi:hypothetical protein